MTSHKPAHEIELFYENGEYLVYVDLPTVNPDAIDLRVHANRLAVSAAAESDETDSGRRRPEGKSDGVNYHRHVDLPRTVDEEAVEANVNDGVLAVRLPIVDQDGEPGTRIEVSK